MAASSDSGTELDGVRALITGGTSGLGLAMAEALAAAGATVVITSRSAERAAAIAARWPSVAGIVADAADEASVARAVREVWSLFGGIDLLVNNAGLGMRTVTPRMLVAGAGRIVNISVNDATMIRRGFVPYGPSRAGSEALSRVMAADLDGTPVTVNNLLPGGATRTGMVPDGAAPRPGLLEPGIMAAPVVWLASAEAATVHDERLVATEFADWLRARQGH